MDFLQWLAFSFLQGSSSIAGPAAVDKDKSFLLTTPFKSRDAIPGKDYLLCNKPNSNGGRLGPSIHKLKFFNFFFDFFVYIFYELCACEL